MGSCLKFVCVRKEEEDHDGMKEPLKPTFENNNNSTNTGLRISSSGSDIDKSSNNLLKENAERIYFESGEEEEIKKISLQDFELVKLLGKGSFGKVLLVQKKDTKILYAMKILKKKFIEEKNQTNHTKTERLILEKMNNPFIVQLHFAFQSSEKLFLVMDFMQGGEMFFHLKKASKFDETKTKFFAAEIVLALEYLHKKKIIYRDLKPENILLDPEGHIKLTDFGLSKYGISPETKTYSVCGTPEYLAPEIFQREGHDKAVDWWSLGALIYEMLSGLPPFYSKDQYKMFKNILEKPIEMKPGFSKEAKSLLRGLLTIDPTQRLGSTLEDSLEIKRHPFFKDIDWDLLAQKKLQPPYKLKVSGPVDLRHFDKCFTTEHFKETFDEANNDSIFSGFTYIKRDFIESKISNVSNN